MANRRRRMALAASTAMLALFVWGAFSHLVIIQGVGYAAIPDEGLFIEAATALAPGLYAFPAPPEWRGEESTDERLTAWEKSFRDGPSGLITVRQRGEAPFSIRKVLVQLGFNALAVALALFVVIRVSGSFQQRATTVTAVGLAGLASVGVIYWNWYGFTNAFFAAQCLDVLGGWTLVGLVLAALAPHPIGMSRSTER
jgi:hypothetical protein